MSEIFYAGETADAGRLDAFTQSGEIDLVFSSEESTEEDVTFPVPFVSAPIVMVTAHHGATPIFVAHARDITTTGFTVRGGRVDEASISITVTFGWIAHGYPDLTGGS